MCISNKFPRDANNHEYRVTDTGDRLQMFEAWLLLTGYVVLDQFCDLSVLPFSHLRSGESHVYLIGFAVRIQRINSYKVLRTLW